MRERISRGKRLDNREWVYWNRYGRLTDINGKPTRIEVNISALRPYAFYINELPVIREETVGDYTGGTDKNGKRIFEGDIVRFDYVDDESNDAHEDFLIFFEEGAFRAQYLGNIKCAPNTLYDEIGNEECYVIGNKWDNPELFLGGEEIKEKNND